MAQYLMYVMASCGTKVPRGDHPVAVVGRQTGNRAAMAACRLEAQQQVKGRVLHLAASPDGSSVARKEEQQWG